MKKTLLFLSSVFVFCCVSAQNKEEITKYNSQKPQYGFIENKGQIHDQNFNANPDVKYLLCLGNGLNVQLKKNSFSYDTYKTEVKVNKKDEFRSKMDPSDSTEEQITYYFHRVDVELIGANANPEIIAEEPSAEYTNYYNAVTPESGATFVRNYKKIIYKNIYSRIDMVFEAYSTNEKPVEYTFIVHPGADAKQIQLHYIGANKTELNYNKINIEVAQGNFTESIPSSWIKETEDKLDITFTNIEENIFGFSIPNYNKFQTLIIDPNPNLEWGTYYGGTLNEESRGMHCDNAGNVYVTGYTQSTNAIASAGAHQTIFGGGSTYIYDAFLIKFNNSGVRQWSTYYGGSDDDVGYGVVTDSLGNVFLSGGTISLNAIATVGSHHSAIGGGWDGFLAKFSSNGVRLWGTYYGGSENDEANYISIDNTGNVFLTGYTVSYNGISTLSAFQATRGANLDAFVVKFDNNGYLMWGTYYGGNNLDRGGGIACDSIGNVYITGYTLSSNVIASIGAHQGAYAGGLHDAFLAKFNTNGVRQWGTYYGGTNDDVGYGLVCDKDNNVLLTGYTSSFTAIATGGSYQSVIGGNYDAFVAKFNSNGVRLWGTYYGGYLEDFADEIVCDKSENIYFVGRTHSLNSISTANAYQITGGGLSNYDAFLVKLNTNGICQWGTYYGGNLDEFAAGIACDTNDNIFCSGGTSSNNSIATIGVHQTILGGNKDVFVAKFSNCIIPAYSGSVGGPLTVCQGEDSILYSVQPILGATSYSWTLPNGAIGTSLSDTMLVSYGTSAISGNITVYGINSCGSGISSTIPIIVNPLPINSGSITGTSMVCVGQDSVLYSIPTINNATSYIWTLPDGTTGSSSNNSIYLSYSDTAVSGNITVYGVNSCGNSISSQFNVTVIPLPDSATIINGSSPVCQGQDSVIYSVGTISVATSYVWTLPNGATGTSLTNSIIVSFDSTAISGNISVKGVNSCGEGVSSILPIIVKTKPDTAGIIAGLLTVCQGQDSILYSIEPISGATSYVWTLPNGTTGTSLSDTILVSYGVSAISGNITVSGINSCGTGISSIVPIVVNSVPNNVSAIIGASTVCVGQDSVLYSIPAINNTTSYFWTLPNGATGLSSNNSIYLSYSDNAVSGNISVYGVNSCGNSISSLFNITVIPLPDSANVISGLSPVCQGQDSVIYSVGAISGATSYVWTLPNGATGTSLSNSIMVSFDSTAISGNISVKGINSCGEGISSILPIIVNTKPDTAGVIIGVKNICQGQDSVLYTVPVIPGATSYVWTLPYGASGISSTDNIILNFNSSAISGDITVFGVNSCGDGVSSQINVIVHLLPDTAGVINGLTIVCQGEDSVTYIVPPIPNALTFVWTLPNGATGISSTNNIIVSYSNSAVSGDITVHGLNSCGDGFYSILPITVNLTPNAPTITINNNVLLSDALVGNQWYNQNGIINGAINQYYIVTADGDYYVIVSSNGCGSDTSNIIHIVTIGVSQNETGSLFELYPCPFVNELIIVNKNNKEKLNFEILNSIGQVVYKGILQEKIIVPTANFASGVYLVKLENGKTFEFKKVIKE